ncbi:MAG: hypothetical protein R3E66_04320 [bacterium]
MNDDARRIFASSPRYTCGAAAAAFALCLRPDQADEQPRDPDPGVLQKQSFLRWCREQHLDLGDIDLEGFQIGNEHHVVGDDRFFYKVTFPSAAGYHVSISPEDGIEFNNSLPIDYLRRQALQTELFDVECDFVGIIGLPYRYQLLTRQQRVVGEPASRDAIREMMLSRGFVELPTRYAQGKENSLSFFDNNYAVFDLRPANVVEAPNGLCIPIDCFVTRLDSDTYQFLLGCV